MIGVMREWLTTVVTVTLLVSVVQMLIPEGTLRKNASFISGLILLVVLLRPLLGMESKTLQMDFAAYERDYSQIHQEFMREGQAVWKQEVERELSERICQQAALWELTVMADVETTVGEEGFPIPTDVVLCCSYHAALSDWIESELGIPAERQFWETLPQKENSAFQD